MSQLNASAAAQARWRQSVRPATMRPVSIHDTPIVDFTLTTPRTNDSGELEEDDDVPLTHYLVRAELDQYEAEQRAFEAEKLERQLQHEVFLARDANEDQRVLRKFHDEENFRWSVPVAHEHRLEPSVRNGKKYRPEVRSAFVDIPDEPLAGSPRVPGAAEPEDVDGIWGDRVAALAVVRENIAEQRRADEFDLEECLFDAAGDSSDDSDGFDHDLEVDWRDLTGDIYSCCRAVEQNCTSEEASTNFGALLRRLKDEELTPSEQGLVWDCIRYTYRKAEPLHHKHWLSGMHHLADKADFANSPSVASFNHIIYAAMDVVCLPERQRLKIRRWANRSTFLVRRRVAVLREIGVPQPTWRDVNASVGGLARAVPVPGYGLPDTVGFITTASEALAPRKSMTDDEIREQLEQLAEESNQERLEDMRADMEAQEAERQANLRQNSTMGSVLQYDGNGFSASFSTTTPRNQNFS
jgi:hypothetical protein